MVDPQDGRPQDEGISRCAEIIPARTPHDIITPQLVPLTGDVLGVSARPHGGSAAGDLCSGLLRRKWLMAGLFTVVAGATIPLIWTTVKPRYQSTAVIQVLPVVTIPYPNATDDNTIGAYQSYVNTQVGIIRSPKVLQRVLDRPQVQQTSWYTQEGIGLAGRRASPDDRLPMDLVVQPRPMTYFIDVSMSTQKPGDAKLIVDAIVDEYIRFDTETRDAARTKTLKTLKESRDDLNVRIGNLRQRIQQRSRSLGTADTDQLRAAMSTQLSGLLARKKEVERELKGIEDRIQMAIGSAATRPASEELRFAIDPEWRRLKEETENTRHRLELALMSTTRGRGHSAIRALEADVQHAETQLRRREELILQMTEEGTVMGGLAMAGPEHLVQLRELKRKELGYLEENLQELSKRVEEASDVAGELVGYDQELRHAQILYTEYQQQIEEMEAGTHALPRVQVMSYGDSRSRPARDRRFLLTGMVLAVAAGLALAVGYLRMTTDRHIHEVRQINMLAQAPFLGRLPRCRRENLPREIGGAPPVEPTASAIETADRAHHALVEGIRMVRTALLERVAETGDKVLLVTSSQAASGKSSVAVLLARTLSTVGRKVLLIEADLRRPTLAERLNVGSNGGLAKLLSGQIADQEAISAPQHLQFDVITAGEIPEGFNLELLSNGAFSSCLERWRKEYDFLLLDSPPVLPIADARILAGHADAAIMVVRAGHDRREDTAEAFSLLASAGERLLGTVFIGGDSGPGYGDGSAYGYPHGYRYGYDDHRRSARDRVGPMAEPSS